MIQGGIQMAVLAVEIVNVDEDVAENAARQAIDLISKITKVKSKTLLLEPHDEYRKIGNYVSDMYEYIPDELKLKSESTYSDDYKTLKIENFIFVDETSN